MTIVLPPGWHAVPEEPDDGMIEAGEEAVRNGEEWGRTVYASEVWTAMLAAAPPPPASCVGELVEALEAAKGYMLNAKIDLETGTKKATTICTLAGGLKMIDAALAAYREKSNG